MPQVFSEVFGQPAKLFIIKVFYLFHCTKLQNSNISYSVRENLQSGDK
jgi:hypothetical protein